MIVVIADDFTGAAEIGGIGLRYGLKVEVNTEVNLQSTADLLVIATDARSMSEKNAVLVMTSVTEQVAKLKPSVVFKKTDSVLRGHVVAELMAQLKVLQIPVALLAPANPSLGRTIVNGQYLVNGQPIHQTDFANDPDFPVKTSSVFNRLHREGVQLHIQQVEEALKSEGIIIGEIGNEDDLNIWAGKADSSKILLAGAADFFSAILNKCGYSQHNTQNTAAINWQAPALIVRGTAFKKQYDEQEHNLTSYMPATIINTPNLSNIDATIYNDWCAAIVSLISKNGKAVIAIQQILNGAELLNAELLRNKMSLIVSKVFKKAGIRELLIEGGSTAFAVLNRLGLTSFYPEKEFATGVVRMRTGNNSELFVTIKPGSYDWPLAVKAEYFTLKKYA